MPKVECPNCSAKMDAPAEYLGRTAKCAKCGKPFTISFRQPSTVAGGSRSARDSSDEDDFVEDDAPPALPPNRRQSVAAAHAPGAAPKIPLGERIATSFVSIFGTLLFLVGALALVISLNMETTAGEAGSRVHNIGLLHSREVGVIVSCAAMASAILILGFNSLRMSAAKTTLAIDRLAAALNDRQ
jgi:hypothetical protein